MAFVQEREPVWLGRNDWYSTYQNELSNGIIVSHNKRYMISRRVKGVPLSKIVGVPGSPGLTNGIQAIFTDVNNGIIPYDKTWTNARASCQGTAGQPGYVPCFDDSIDLIAESVYNGNRHPSIVFAQIMEDGNIHGSSNPDGHSRFFKVEQILRKVGELIQQRDGISVKDNWLIADYFNGIYGWGTNVEFNNLGFNTAIAQVQNATEARKTNHNDQNGYFDSLYYSNSAFDYRHRIVPGYIEGLGSQFRGRGLYNAVYNLERNYIAKGDRKCVCYANGTVEGLGLPGTDRSGVWQRYPTRNAQGVYTGDLIRLSSIEGNYDLLKAYSLIHLLIADAYVIWDDHSQWGTDDKRYGLAYFGGPEPWKNKFQKDATSPIVQYNPNDPNQPKSLPTDDDNPGFSTVHTPHNNGSWAGNYLYGKIWNRTTNSLVWANFSYVENGVSKSGYYNGNSPVMGDLGDGSVSRFDHPNPKSAENAVRQWYSDMRPMLWKGTGPAGTVYIGLNIHAGPLGTTTYNTPDGSFTHRGNGIFVFTV